MAPRQSHPAGIFAPFASAREPRRARFHGRSPVFARLRGAAYPMEEPLSPSKQRAPLKDTPKITTHARQHLPCADCGAAPGAACTRPGKGKTVCRARYIAAAIALRQHARAAQRTSEQATEVDTLFASLPRLSPAEIDAGRSPSGGFTRAQLAAWGVPWPPPAGWLHALLRKAEDQLDTARDAA